MPNKIIYDLAIIGAGAGGLSVAAVAAQLDLKVALIEQNKMGGDCLNAGCIPSKSLIAAAHAARTFITCEPFGIKPVTPEIDFARVMAYVAHVINQLAPNDSVERFTTLGAHVIQGLAKFIDKNTLLVNNTKIQARRFIIATGSSPAIPPIPGLTETNYFTNETIFNLQTKPEHLIIIGAGPIGCEMAQAFLHLGVKVTLLEAFTMMPRDEPELVDCLRQLFKEQGITLYEKINILQIKEINKIITITLGSTENSQTVSGSHLLIATGRMPNIKNLALEKAGVAYTPKGIQVNAYLQTSNKKIYAMGDAAGSFQFTHVANYHAGIIIRHAIFKLRQKVNYRAISWVTYTTPELAHTGMLSKEALALNPKNKIFILPFTENDRAVTANETVGMIKICVSPKGLILGASILAPHAGELILPWIQAIHQQKTLRELTDITIPYPTLNELSKRVAGLFYTPTLFSTVTKKIVNILKYF